MVSFTAGEDEDEFENFMLPLTVSFESVAQLFNSNFVQEEAKVGLFPLQRKKLLMGKTNSGTSI